MNWYIEVLRKYVVFNGRARRREYWFFFLVNLVVFSALALIDNGTGTFDPESGVGLLSGIYSLAVLLPTIGVGVRRLHDTGRSGWWLLIGFVPVIGFFVLLYFLVQDSESGTNAHGDNPKAPDMAAAAA